jgi:hypothetical protein
LGSGSSIVTVMQPADSVVRKHTTRRFGTCPVVGCSLPQPEVGAVVMIVADIISEQPFQMEFIQRNDVIQQVCPAAFDPPFRHPVLPRTLERSSHRSDGHRLNRTRHLQAVLRVPINDQESRTRSIRKRFPQLLDDPRARRMPCDVEVHDPPTIMADDEEAIEHAECDRWHCEEVHRSNGFPMVAQKRNPALGWFGISRYPAHPAGDRALRDIKAEHEEFTMDAWRSPGWILANHPEDQVSNLFGDSLPAEHAACSGDSPPVQGKPSSVPSHDCFRVHDDESLFPT